MRPEDRRQKHPQGVRRCVPRCCAATLPQTQDSIVVAAESRHLYGRAALRHTKSLSSVIRPPSSERGSSLIVSLIILIILMLLGVTAITTSDTQLRLAANLQFEDTAMNNAEVAISTGEKWLRDGANFQSAGLTSDTCGNRSVSHLYPLNNTVTPPTPCLAGYAAPGNDPLTMVWDNSNSAEVTAGNTKQRYFIEQMSVNQTLVGSNVTLGSGSAGCTKVNTYRITARGVGQREATKFVQSYFSVLINNSNPAVTC